MDYQRSHTRGWGFTLIELLVVISIIALLMGILIPMLGRVRNQARAVVCKAQLREWGVAFWLYATEHDDIPGRVCKSTATSRKWYEDLRPYYDSNDLLCCPMARKMNPTPDGPGSSWHNGTTFLAWGNTDRNLHGSYGMSRRLHYVPVNTIREGEAGYTKWFNKDAANMPVPMDSRSSVPDMHHNEKPPEIPEISGPQTASNTVCMDRHNRGINMLFGDQTVRKVGPKELWVLKWFPGFNTSGPWTIAGGVQPDDWPQWMRKYKDY